MRFPHAMRYFIRSMYLHLQKNEPDDSVVIGLVDLPSP